MARTLAGFSHTGAVWLSWLTGPRLPLLGCASNPSDPGFAAPGISWLFPALPGVCTDLEYGAENTRSVRSASYRSAPS